MKENEQSLINQLENIDNCIVDECQENLYFVADDNDKAAVRIRNASFLLLNNAMRIVRHQSSIIKTLAAELTLERTKDLMTEMCQILYERDNFLNKENKIRKLMAEKFALNAPELLKNPPSSDIEYQKNKIILQDF